MASIGVFCSSSQRLEELWLNLAADVGTELGRRGHVLVSGGGCVGMMGAVADAARDAGARTVGVIPQSLVDLEVADQDADELIITADMASRKTLMVEKADAFLVLPGGLGTLDELFEVWTTGVLGLHAKRTVLLDTDGFYAGLVEWLAGAVEERFVLARALAAVRIVQTVDGALDVIERVD
jgi:uncharacterized protein (TIGR00730 family)